MQPRFRDWTYCEICEKNYTDNKFVAVIVDNDKRGAENETRSCYICKNCLDKCITDPAFEKLVTEKVFRLSLGRKIKGGNDEMRMPRTKREFVDELLKAFERGLVEGYGIRHDDTKNEEMEAKKRFIKLLSIRYKLKDLGEEEIKC